MAQEPSSLENSQKGFKGADYNYVAVNSKLRLVGLVKNTFSVSASCIADQKSWKLSYAWEENACSFDSKRGVVSAMFQYLVIAKLGRKTAMRCAAEYVVLYSLPLDSEAEAAEGFCHNVGLFAAYPYFRGLVAQLASSANLVLPPLPSIASTAHIPKKSNEDTQGERS